MATSTSAARFVSLDKEELDKIVDEKDARSTKRVVGSSVNVLKEYCEAKEPQRNIFDGNWEFCSRRAELIHSDILRLRGGKTRRMNGQLYDYAKRSTWITLRYGLQKHFSRVKKKSTLWMIHNLRRLMRWFMQFSWN